MRYLLFLLALPLAASITCPNSIPAGGTGTCTSNAGSVAWSATGGASVSPSSGTSTVVTMPSGVVAQHQAEGCPVLPNDSYFNTRIDGSVPVDSHSATKISKLQVNGFIPISFQPSWGVSLADASTPITSFKGYYDAANWSVPFPSGYGLLKESGNANFIFGWKSIGNDNPDEHANIVKTSDCSFYDVYDPYSSGTVSICHDGTTAGCNVQSVGTYSWVSPYSLMVGGTDAASLPLLPLTWHVDEIKKGVPGHAIRGTWSTNEFTSGPSYATTFMWPAQASAGGCYVGSGCLGGDPTFDGSGNSTNYIELGSRMRLKASFTTSGVCGTDTASPTAACSISGSGGICTRGTTIQNTYCTNILTGLQRYGTFNADTGTGNALQPNGDISTDPDVLAAFYIISNANISSSNYEVVDTQASGMFYQSGSNQVTPNGQAGTTATWGGITFPGATQSTITPLNQVIVTGGSFKSSVAIQPITIGSKLPAGLSGVMSGAGAITLGSWVNPSTVSQSVTWSIVGSGCGSISGSTYTPPTTSSIVSCSLHAVAAADSAATMDIGFKVLPATSGALRVDIGAPTSTTDGFGNVWQPDVPPYGLFAQNSPMTSSPSHWTGKWATQYSTATFAPFADLRYVFLAAANAHYKLHLLYGWPDGFVSYPCGSWPGYSNWGINNWDPINIEVNGTIVAHTYNMGQVSGFVCDVPADVYVPVATDASGMIEIANLTLAPDVPFVNGSFNVTTPYTGPNLAPATGNKYTIIAGVEIVPDATAAHWAIDTQGQATIGAGQTHQPYFVTDWYTGVNDPVWSLVSDPTRLASINSSTGVLTMASGTPLARQPIVVKATSASNSLISATVTIYSVGTKTVFNPIPLPPIVNHYNYVRSITIDHTKVPSTQANFPVLVSFTDPTLATVANGGHVQNIHGYDIVFASNSSGTPSLINWELESYDPVGGTVIAHVLASSLSSTTNTVLYVYYGNPTVVTAQNATPTATWDSNFTAVYHLATTAGKDSTSNARNGTSTGSSIVAAIGQIDGAVQSPSSADTNAYITVPTSVLNQSIGTISMWLKSALDQTSFWTAAGFSDGTSNNRFFFERANGSGVSYGWYTGGGSGDYRLTCATSPSVNTWHLLTYEWQASGSVLYVDGVNASCTSAPVASTFAPSVAELINEAALGSSIQGYEDEIRFSNSLRSTSWITAEYNNQSSPSTFLAVGSELAN